MANIKDVAKLAGVSISTVSRVVNDSAGVTRENQCAVHRAMKELSYQPNIFAKSLVSNTSNTIGLVVANLADPFFGLLMQGVETVALRHNKQLVISAGHDKAELEKKAIQSLIDRRCDTLIIHSKYLTDYQIMELLENQPASVIINRKIPDIEHRCIYINNRTLAKTAVDYLIEQGHKEIALLIPDNYLSDIEQRKQGYQDALAGQGIILDELKIASAAATEDGSYQATLELLDRNTSFSAIFAYDGFMAKGCLKALKEKKVKVPGDISLIAIDDGLPARYFHPELTVVSYPIERLGEAAAKLAVAFFEKNREIDSDQFNSEIMSKKTVSKRK